MYFSGADDFHSKHDTGCPIFTGWRQPWLSFFFFLMRLTYSRRCSFASNTTRLSFVYASMVLSAWAEFVGCFGVLQILGTTLYIWTDGRCIGVGDALVKTVARASDRTIVQLFGLYFGLLYFYLSLMQCWQLSYHAFKKKLFSFSHVTYQESQCAEEGTHNRNLR